MSEHWENESFGSEAGGVHCPGCGNWFATMAEMSEHIVSCISYRIKLKKMAPENEGPTPPKKDPKPGRLITFPGGQKKK